MTKNVEDNSTAETKTSSAITGVGVLLAFVAVVLCLTGIFLDSGVSVAVKCIRAAGVISIFAVVAFVLAYFLKRSEDLAIENDAPYDDVEPGYPASWLDSEDGDYDFTEEIRNSDG